MIRTHMDQQLQPQGIEECRPWLLVLGQKEEQPLSLREQGWEVSFAREVTGKSAGVWTGCASMGEHCPPVLAAGSGVSGPAAHTADCSL